VIHRTYRSLDAPVKLVGFTLRQWLGILAGAGLVIGLVVAAGLPAKAAISLCTLLIGVPVAMTYVSENGGLQLTTMLRDCVRWRLGPHELRAVRPPRAYTPGVLVEGGAFEASETDVPAPASAAREGWGA
jgi:anaerobic C4-dicarboxylate transporter